MTDEEFYFRFFEVVGVWAAAFATVGATVVALMLGRRQSSERLSLWIEERTDALDGHFIILHIRNIGNVDVQVTGLLAKFGYRRNSSLNMIEVESSDCLPKIITPKRALRLVPIIVGTFTDSVWTMLPEIFVHVKGMRLWSFLATYRLEVLTAGGAQFRCRPPRRLMKCIASELRSGIETRG